jgi:hypothetical protein
MSTTQLFVEQLFIGFMVLLIGALPVLPEIRPYLGHAQDLGDSLGIATAVGGAAYLLGIVFDRLADSLLANLEQHHRLRYALFDRRAGLWSDPWPEPQLRFRVLRAGGRIDRRPLRLSAIADPTVALAHRFPPGVDLRRCAGAGRAAADITLPRVAGDGHPCGLSPGAGGSSGNRAAQDQQIAGRQGLPGGSLEDASFGGPPAMQEAGDRRCEELQRINQDLTVLLRGLHDDRRPLPPAEADKK